MNKAPSTQATRPLKGLVLPFQSTSTSPIHVEASVLDWPRLWINGGSRGFLTGLEPVAVMKALKPIPVRMGIG